MNEVETPKNNIYLAMVPPTGPEVHIKWDSHNSLAKAEKELKEIRSYMLLQDKKPYDCYVYEGVTPILGFKSYKLEEVDMNFYEEREQTLESKLKFERFMYDLSKKAGINK